MISHRFTTLRGRADEQRPGSDKHHSPVLHLSELCEGSTCLTVGSELTAAPAHTTTQDV